MTGLFSKSRSGPDQGKVRFVDLEGQELKAGDVVMSLRYELGESRIISTENGFEYESVASGKRMSWSKMIDAATGYQKVRKLES
jgi:hypothetical protein